MSLTTPLTTLLGIEHPILLAPMGGVAGGALAAAVSAGGGLGFVGGGYADPDDLRRELDRAGDARVGVGFITFSLDERPASLAIALERRPPVVQLSFGDPRPYVDDIHAAGALFIAQVQTLAEARAAVAAGASAVIAQGQDSGGHGRSGRGTVGLVPAVVDAVAPRPVVAAGGLADGRGLAAALALGAAGISLGTRFFASAEALSDPAAAAGLVAAAADDTERTEVFDAIRGPAWPAGYDARAVRNRLTEWWDTDPDRARHHDEQVERFRAAAADDYSVRPLWAGEGIDLVGSIEPAAGIVTGIVAEAERILRALP